MGVYFYPGLLLAGGLGALFRFWLGRITVSGSLSWLPIGTLAANLIGCFLIGFLTALFAKTWSVSADFERVILTGFLGGFTTFSAFSLETVMLFEQGAWQRAIIYVVASVTLSVILCLVGYLLARHTFS